AGELVYPGDRDAIDMRVRIEDVDAEEVVVRRGRRNAPLVAAIDREPADRHIGAGYDGDDRVLGGAAGVGICGMGGQRCRSGGLDDGLARASALDRDVLSADRHLLAVSARRHEDAVTVRRRVDRGLDRRVATMADQQEVMAGAVADLLDAVEKIDPLRSGTYLPASLVAGGRRTGSAARSGVRRCQRAAVPRRVEAGAAKDRVVAQPAGERVVAVIAIEDVVAAQAGQGIVAAIAGDDVGGV